MFNYILYVVLFCILFLSSTFALEPVAIFKTWSIFQTKVNNKDVCYLFSLPIEKRGNYKQRGEPYIILTKLVESNFFEVSVSNGYPYTKDKADVMILKRKFPLITDEEKAMTYDRNDDVEIVRLMHIGAKMYVTGYFTNGSYAVDTYSLIGFTEAYNELNRICREY